MTKRKRNLYLFKEGTVLLVLDVYGIGYRRLATNGNIEFYNKDFVSCLPHRRSWWAVCNKITLEEYAVLLLTNKVKEIPDKAKDE